MPISPKKCLLYLSLLLLIVACKEEEPFEPPPPIIPTFTEACCTLPALEETINGKNVYLANVFTPNGDGINDFAVVYAETDIEIEQFAIYKNDTVHFSRLNFLPNDPSLGWDGLTSTGYRNDYFNYSLTISGKNFQGTISSWRCNGVVFPDSILQCQFPAQWNGDGYDPGLPSLEDCN